MTLWLMSFPDPTEDPLAFLRHLKALNLIFTINAFDHYLIHPADLGCCLDEGLASSWCDHMDTLLVSPNLIISISNDWNH